MYVFDHYIPYRNYYKNTIVALQDNNLVAYGQFINKDFIIVAPYASYSSASYVIIDVSQSTFISSNNIPINLQPYQFYITNTISLLDTQYILNQLNSLSQYYNSVLQSESSASILSYSSFTILSDLYASLSQDLQQSSIGYSAFYLQFSGDVTYWPTQYVLSQYQSLIITFTNSQTLYIPLQLSGQDIYKLYLIQIPQNNSGLNVYLYPANSTIKNIYVGINIDDVKYSTFGNVNDAFNLTTVASQLEATIINNEPFTKTMISQDMQILYYDNNAPASTLMAQIWDDYTTFWYSFGTIVFDQRSSGIIIIKREI